MSTRPTKKPAKKKSPAPRRAKTATPRAKPAASKTPVVPALLTKIVQALDAKKAADIRVLAVGELSSITDFLVVATATSDPHLRALRVELEKVIDGEGAKLLGIDTSKGSGWTVVDAFDVMIHLFTPENREKYRIELLWQDAQAIDVAKLV